jgi:glycosyltransferase involved in cell wall biosynthesis
MRTNVVPVPPVDAGEGEACQETLKMSASSHLRIIAATAAKRIAIVSPLVARHDAVSAAVRDNFRALSTESVWEVGLLTTSNHFPDQPSHIVSGVAELLLDPVFLAADLILYHFAIYSPLFDALLVGNGHAKQVVNFHNVTPRQFVTHDQRILNDMSFRQLCNLHRADRFWCDSRVNADVLVAHGLNPNHVSVHPLVVEHPALACLADKPVPPVEILFVGRIVPSKGVLDLIEAVDILRRGCSVPFKLRLVGNLSFSDSAYVSRVRRAIVDKHLGEVVQFIGTVDDAGLERLYHRAHIFAIPSYHEGFCKPVIEALRAGCVPVGYSAHNLQYIANGFGRMVPTGDIAALAEALAAVLQGIVNPGLAAGATCLPLDRGRLSAAELNAKVRVYVEEFTFDRLVGRTVQAVRGLI